MSLLATTLPLSAVFMAFVATLHRKHGGTSEAPGWTTAAVVALGAYGVFVVPYLLLLRWRVFGKGREQLLAKGIDPAGFMGLAGMNMFFLPTGVAMFLTFAGFPLLFLYITTVYSLLGLAVWPFVYRR